MPSRFVMLACALLAPAATAAQTPADSVDPRPNRLYRSDAPLPLTLRADWKQVFRDRDTARVDSVPATLRYLEEEGDTVTFDLHVATRGHFRLRSSTCSFPPLRILFTDGTTRGTLFRGDRTLKLVTHCQDSDTYEQYLLREYLAYRIFNVLTDRSFRVRLARITYEDTTGRDPVTRWGFFVEDDEDMARRNGGQILDFRGVRMEESDTDHMGLVGIYQYMIGNTDFSIPYLHNIKMVMRGAEFFPVPYDLDWAGLVDARYARPDYRLNLRSVRDRLYRGQCLPSNVLVETVGLFNQKRAEIEMLIQSVPGLDDGSRKWATEYLEDFYETVNDNRDVEREILRVCY